MPTLAIPCIRKVNRDGGGDVDVNFSFGAGEDGGGAGYILISPPGSPIDIGIVPFPPFVLPIPDFAVIFDDLFGKSTIQRQKDEIQRYLTQVLRYVSNTYGFPLADDHALQFKSSGVRREFLKRPDLAILADAMWTDADAIITGAFGYDKSGPGIHERFVNQFLANASYNLWPLQATLDLWQAIVKASTCPRPTKPVPPPPEPLPPPPPPPPPPPRANCPPGMTMDVCLETCGKIRQLTAAQQPLPPELLTVLGYFRDCILPPDGSWQYQAPIWQTSWQTKAIAALPFLPQSDEIRIVPPEYWPYNFPQGTTEVDIISSAAPGSKYPVNTIAILGQPDYQYIITPDGQLHCRYDPPSGSPDPLDVDDPPDPEPPPDLTEPLAQLRREFELMRADYQQFKQVVFQQFDSLKDVIWRTNIRGNFQAAEVYAADQPGWQGPRPAAQQPALPPGWQVLPTPGFPQVLELPPIQEFPQAPGPQPPDLTGIEERLNEIELTDVQLNQDIAQLAQQIPVAIINAIDLYDRDVEKPDIQKIRDECCTPKGPLTPEQRERICEEGRLKWGIMAECWLNENTPDVDPASIQFPVRLTGQDIATELRLALSDIPSGWFADKIAGYADKIRAGLASSTMPGPRLPSDVQTADLSYVYEKAPGA